MAMIGPKLFADNGLDVVLSFERQYKWNLVGTVSNKVYQNTTDTMVCTISGLGIGSGVPYTPVWNAVNVCWTVTIPYADMSGFGGSTPRFAAALSNSTDALFGVDSDVFEWSGTYSKIAADAAAAKTAAQAVATDAAACTAGSIHAQLDSIKGNTQALAVDAASCTHGSLHNELNRISAVTDQLPNAGALSDLATVKSRIGDPADPNNSGNINTLTFQIGHPTTAHLADDVAGISGHVDTVMGRVGDPGGGNTVVSKIANVQTQVDKIDALATALENLSDLSGGTENVQIGYVSTTGLLTIKTLSADKWDIALTGSPTRVRITVGGTVFDSDTYSGDFTTFLAAIAGAPNIAECVGVSGGFYIRAQPGVALTTVTTLLVTGGTGTITHSETGALTATKWVQYYEDDACTTLRNGTMGGAGGKKRLNAAP